MSINFFNNNSNNTSANLFDSIDSSDIDLRAELHKIIYDEGRGTTVIYRKVKLDSIGKPLKCACWDPLTLEPDIDTQCRNCRGVGYVFQDYIVRGYRSQSQGYSNSRKHREYGVDQNEFRAFYFEHNFISVQTLDNLDIPSRYDKIIEVKTDINGVILSPLSQVIKYDIISVDPYRLEEGGRLEYYRVRALASLEGSWLI